MAHIHSGIALLSAGLDSSVALALAKEQGTLIALALTFDYGQKAASQEIRQAQRLAAFWQIPHKVIALPFFSEKSQSSLLKTTPSQPIPELNLKDLEDRVQTLQSAKSVWVPNRNGVFLEIAACFAEQLEVEKVIVGFNREEASTFPDNSISYRKALTEALSFSTSNQVEIISPTEELDKTEIVKKALALKIPLEFLWSCYHDGNQMCGTCESCMRLKRALKRNEVPLDSFFKDTRF